MSNRSNDSTTTVKVVCAILFITFIISYTYSFQGDILGMTQYAWADGKTHYDRTVGAGVITAFMILISAVTCFFTRLPQRLFSLNFFPAFLAMGLLTAGELSGRSVEVYTSSIIISVLLLLIYPSILHTANTYKPFLIPLRSIGIFSQPWWTNIALLVVMMLMTYSMGNTDRTLHNRLAIERLCMEQQWDKALDTGFPQYDNDSSMTMLRAMALARKGELGEKLFSYDITGNSRSLIPQSDYSVSFLLGNGYNLWQTLGFVPRSLNEHTDQILKRELRRGTARPVARDYLLCSYLMDKDLKSFTRALPLYYKIDNALPQHYREAYILYCKKYNQPNLLANDAIMTDYEDFLSVMRKFRNTTLVKSALRDAFFGTYWYYYYRD